MQAAERQKQFNQRPRAVFVMPNPSGGASRLETSNFRWCNYLKKAIRYAILLILLRRQSEGDRNAPRMANIVINVNDEPDRRVFRWAAIRLDVLRAAHFLHYNFHYSPLGHTHFLGNRPESTILHTNFNSKMALCMLQLTICMAWLTLHVIFL